MKGFWISYSISSILTGLLLGVLFYTANPFSENKNKTIFSPLPDFLTQITNGQVVSLTIYTPKTDVMASSTKKLPVVNAQAALIYDLTMDKPIYEKNAAKRLPMASLTKIATAIVALENKKIPNLYSVSRQSLVGEDSMGLSAGENLTLEELLYGLMLPSGNDAAEVLAENYEFGRDSFIKAMNHKAKALGLKNTHFTNPSGLQGDGDQHTTAYDLLVLTRYALNNFPIFRKVVSTFEHSIPYTKTHKTFYLQNETNLLTSYPGVKGVKTGYTPEAGLCLVTYFDYGGHELIGVLLGSNNRREEMRDMLDYSLKTLGIIPPRGR